MPRLVNSWTASALLKFARLEIAEKRGERFLRLATGARSRITEISDSEVSAAINRGMDRRRFFNLAQESTHRGLTGLKRLIAKVGPPAP
jgi:hypothetical protein